MKRAFIIFCFLAYAVLNVACAKTTGNLQNVASQDAFLKDMAAGITKRINDDRDSDNMSAEEIKEYYGDLVGYELSYIEKYSKAQFEDVVFNELAHRYIEACLAQRSAMSFFKNEDLYNALWTGGRAVRSGIIVAMYEQYDLDISSEQADGYRTSGADSTSYTLSTDNDTYDEAAAVHISKANPNPVIYNENGIKISVKSCNVNWQNYVIKFIVDNNGDKNIAVSIGGVTINNFEISSAHDFGSIAPGNSGFMSGYISLSDLKEAGLKDNFDEINCNIWLSDGEVILADYYVRIPAKIDSDVFIQE